MQIINAITTKNPCFTIGRTISIKGAMLHSVGCSQPKAQVFINTWNNKNCNVGVHAVIDANDGSVFQTLPWNYKAWHAGSPANNSYIGVEMCESNYIQYISGGKFNVLDLTKAREHCRNAYTSAVKLFAYLCIRYNFSPDAILSHSEGYRKGIATNHGDPEHYWRGLGMPYTMDGFRSDVKKILNNKNLEEESEKMENEIKELKARVEALEGDVAKLKNVAGNTFIWNYVDENMPDWAKPAVSAAMTCGAINGSGENGELGLTYSDLRAIVREYRAGLYSMATAKYTV